MMTRNFLMSVATLLAVLAFATSPYFSDGFNGFTADQFPIPQVDAPVQPAGYAFAIWGLIYAWLIAGALFGLIFRSGSGDWAPMRPALVLSLLVGAAWIPVANLSAPWATVMIWGMLIAAVLALALAGKSDRWWQRVPVALYAGWLTAASCVALGLVLAGHGILGPVIAALAMLTLALSIALVVQTLRPDEPLYTAAVIWALVAVIVSNLSPPLWPVLVLAGAGAVVLAFRAWRLG